MIHLLIPELYKSFACLFDFLQLTCCLTYLLNCLFIYVFKNRPVFRFHAGGHKRRPHLVFVFGVYFVL